MMIKNAVPYLKNVAQPISFLLFLHQILPMNPTKTIKLALILILSGLFSWRTTFAQNPVNWTNDQLLQPSDLAATLKDNKEVAVIFSVGPGAIIPHSRDMGMIKEQQNMKKFKQELENLPKDTSIIIYCGCCPYEHCPNVRPAIQLLKDMKFTNYKLLDLPDNIKIDWINKGYPTQ